MAQDPDIGDRLATVGEHHRDISQNPAAIVNGNEPAASHSPGQFGREPHTVRQQTRRQSPGVRNHPDTISGNGTAARIGDC